MMTIFCTNCGNSISSSHKFCSSCGKSVTSSKITDEFNALNKLNLLKGLDIYVNELLEKQPKATPYLALESLIKEYPQRYGANGKLLSFIKADTKEFIFKNEFTEIFDTEINANELKKLSKEDKNSFDKYLPLFNGFRTDIIATGYLWRVLSEHENINAKFEQLKGINTPKGVFSKLFSYADSQPDMFSDERFSFPYGATMVFGDKYKGLLATISNNINTNKMGKVFLLPDSRNVMLMLLIGWCLGRYDWGRKLHRI